MPFLMIRNDITKVTADAIVAFLESTGFEDALRNAVSLGGGSDTPCLHHRRHCRSFLRDATGTAGRDLEASAGGSAGSVRAVPAEP